MNAQNQMAGVTKFVRTTREVTAARASMASCYRLTGKHAKVNTTDKGFLLGYHLRSATGIQLTSFRNGKGHP